MRSPSQESSDFDMRTTEVPINKPLRPALPTSRENVNNAPLFTSPRHSIDDRLRKHENQPKRAGVGALAGELVKETRFLRKPFPTNKAWKNQQDLELAQELTHLKQSGHLPSIDHGAHPKIRHRVVHRPKPLCKQERTRLQNRNSPGVLHQSLVPGPRQPLSIRVLQRASRKRQETGSELPNPPSRVALVSLGLLCLPLRHLTRMTWSTWMCARAITLPTQCSPTTLQPLLSVKSSRQMLQRTS